MSWTTAPDSIPRTSTGSSKRGSPGADGYGLGLPVVRRIAASTGLEVRAIADGRGHVEMTFPRRLCSRVVRLRADSPRKPRRMTTTTEARARSGRLMLNKVPEVTIWFWVIKILCTTVGESFADWINMTLGVGLVNTAVIFTVVFAVVLAVQLRLTRYVPFAYWLTVVVVSVTGTLYTDILTDQLGVPLWISTRSSRCCSRSSSASGGRGSAPCRSTASSPRPARVVLLARRPGHLRARHRGRRLDPGAHRLEPGRLGPAAARPIAVVIGCGGSAPTRCCPSGSPTS